MTMKTLMTVAALALGVAACKPAQPAAAAKADIKTPQGAATAVAAKDETGAKAIAAPPCDCFPSPSNTAAAAKGGAIAAPTSVLATGSAASLPSARRSVELAGRDDTRARAHRNYVSRASWARTPDHKGAARTGHAATRGGRAPYAGSAPYSEQDVGYGGYRAGDGAAYGRQDYQSGSRMTDGGRYDRRQYDGPPAGYARGEGRSAERSYTQSSGYAERGYVQGGYGQGGYAPPPPPPPGYGQGGYGYVTARAYNVSQSTRGDVRRSRAEIRTRCPQ